MCPPPSPRCLEALLRAGRGPCVLADTAELPTLADIQLAHLKLWALCLHGERGTGTLGSPRAHSGVGGGHPRAPRPALTPPPFACTAQARRPRRSGCRRWRRRAGWTTCGERGAVLGCGGKPDPQNSPPPWPPHPVSGSPHHPQQPQGDEAPRRRGGYPDPTVCGGGWRPPRAGGGNILGCPDPPPAPLLTPAPA